MARSSGGPSRERPKLGFPAAIVAIIVAGTIMVAWARTSTDSSIDETAPTPADFWTAAYGIYVCDGFEPSLAEVEGAPATGIKPFEGSDGVIQINPLGPASSGDNATWSVFGESVGLTFDGASFTLPDGTTYEDGHDCGGSSATVALYQWPAGDAGASPIVDESDPGGVRFSEDQLAFTLAVVPEGTEVPRPPSAADLAGLSAPLEVPQGAETTEPSGDATETTETTEPSGDATETTVDAEEAPDTTVAGGGGS